MNYLYLNNPTVPMTTNPSFNFSRKNEKIDWRRIAAIDVDRVSRDLDFQVLQENIEQIALCNIEAEIDYRAIDPNFLKLYKLSQLIIEYLLLCQDQISQQLMQNESNKMKNSTEIEEFRREIDKLKNELNSTKKESKKRKKLIESQQKMLMARQPTHHSCPVCGHSFLNGEYLQSHIQRRHPEFDPQRRREHDVDAEKELQRFKDELKSKENELKIVQIEKAVDEAKLKERDETIRELKDEIHKISSRRTLLEEQIIDLRSSQQLQSGPSRHRDENLTDLIKQNQVLQAENEQLKHNFKQSEKTRKKDEKRLKEQIETLQKRLDDANRHTGNNDGLSKELEQYRTQYHEEKARRKQLEKDLNEAHQELAQLRNHPPPIFDRKSPIAPPRSTASPPPISVPKVTEPPKSTRKSSDVLLPQHCPAVVSKMNQDGKYLKKYREKIRNDFDDELDQFGGLNIREKETRLKTSELGAKMAIIEVARQNMQRDLPSFERIRTDISNTLEKLIRDRFSTVGASSTSARSSGPKNVKFQDETRAVVSSIKRPINPAPSSDEESSASKNYRDDFQSASDDEEKVKPKKNVGQIVKVLDKKLIQSSQSGTKPTINAIAQGFQPTRETVMTKTTNIQSDDDDDDSVTTITTNPPVRSTISQIPKPNYLSSGELSQNTYDSQLRSGPVKGMNAPQSEDEDDEDDDDDDDDEDN